MNTSLGEIHLRRAEAAAEEGNLERARELYAKAIGCYEEGRTEGALARVGVAAVFAELDKLEDAWAALSAAEPVLEQADDAGLHARALNQMGLVKRRMGEEDEARGFHERARQVASGAGDLRQQAVALRNLAGIERAQGNFERTVALLTESAQMQEAEGEPRSVALIWRQIRTVELEAGRIAKAFQGVRRELALRESLGEDVAIAATLFEAAGIARLLGRWDEACAWLRRAAELRVQAEDMEGAAKALLGSGELLLEARRPRAARGKLEAARDTLGEQGPVELRASLWRALAETDLQLLEAYLCEDDPLLHTQEEGASGTGGEEALADHQLLRRSREEAEEALTLAQQTSRGSLRAAALTVRARVSALAGEREAREQFRAAVKEIEDLREEPYDLTGSYRTFLEYGRWLSRQDQARQDGAQDQRAARDYLERAAGRAEEAMNLGVSGAPAALARAALALHFVRSGDKEVASAQLEQATTNLGSAVGDPEGPGSNARRALSRVSKLLRADPLGSDRLLRDADEAARIHLARLSPDTLRDALYDLRRLQEISKALNSELELDRLLGLIIDAAIDLVGAERGFLILTGSQPDEVAFKVARNIERTEVERPGRKVSNTIARLVIDSGQPVVTGDAAQDERFSGTQSVAEQRLRSVAAVPLRVQGRLTGTLYLDHRYKGELFGPLAIELLESLADHAAIALENARLRAEERARAETLAVEKARLADRVETQSQQLEHIKERLAAKSRAEGNRYRYEQIVGTSPPMQKVFALLDKVVASTIPVFIHGESGTGKELIARALHYNSPRADGPFVSENFAAIADELLASELFGHVQGSFTGAISDKKGLFERASGGTIFLDEIGDLSEQMQKELLRVLEEREVRPVGAADSIPIDVRVVSATHQDLKKMVAEGKFRQDLFYRLHVLAVELPPLRERREDIPILVERFLAEHAAANKQPVKGIDSEALRKLQAFHWPGNVRELKNFVDRTALLCRGAEIHAEDVEFDSEGASATEQDLSLVDWSEAKEAFAKRYLVSVLARVGGNVSLAARESGMLRQAFQRLLKRHDIDPEGFRGKR